MEHTMLSGPAHVAFRNHRDKSHTSSRIRSNKFNTVILISVQQNNIILQPLSTPGYYMLVLTFKI